MSCQNLTTKSRINHYKHTPEQFVEQGLLSLINFIMNPCEIMVDSRELSSHDARTRVTLRLTNLEI